MESNREILADIFRLLWTILKAFLGWAFDGLLVAFIVHQFWFWWTTGLFGVFDELSFILVVLMVVFFIIARVRERKMIRESR